MNNLPDETGDLQSSSDHRDKGLMSPNMRRPHLERILTELRVGEDVGKPATREEREAAQDLCFRLYSHEVSSQIAADLGCTKEHIRKALDRALQWAPKE